MELPVAKLCSAPKQSRLFKCFIIVLCKTTFVVVSFFTCSGLRLFFHLNTGVGDVVEMVQYSCQNSLMDEDGIRPVADFPD